MLILEVITYVLLVIATFLVAIQVLFWGAK